MQRDGQPLQDILSRLRGVKLLHGGQWAAHCPAHDDQHASLSLCRGRKGQVLLHCHAGCASKAVCDAMGVRMADLSPEKGNAAGKEKRRIVAIYDYCDERQTLLFQVVRYVPKSFRQRRPDGKGAWIWNLNGVRRVLYRLPDLLAASPESFIFVVEGEKDADRLTRCGLISTTNPGGAGKWSKVDVAPLYGRQIVIIPDSDEAGRRHSEEIAAALQDKAKCVRVVDLPGDVKDVSDYLDAGGDPEDLWRLAEATPPWKPSVVCREGHSDRPVIEPFMPFPVEAMPEPLRTFIAVGAKAIGCDPSYIALPLLAATASVIGNARRIQLKLGWTEPAVLWTALVGESGTMKTPAFRLAMKPLRSLQRDELRSHQDRLAHYERATMHYEKELRTWKNSKSTGEPPEKPEEPQPARFVVSDVTVEALAPILKSNWRGLLLARDEIGGWIASFDRYASGRGSDAAHWLSMFNAETLIVDRKTGPIRTLMVDHAAVSVTGGIQPGTLGRAVGTEHRENGLLARLLLAWPVRCWPSRKTIATNGSWWNGFSVEGGV